MEHHHSTQGGVHSPGRRTARPRRDPCRRPGSFTFCAAAVPATRPPECWPPLTVCRCRPAHPMRRALCACILLSAAAMRVQQDVVFPLYDQVKAEHVVPGMRSLLADLHKEIDALEASGGAWLAVVWLCGLRARQLVRQLVQPRSFHTLTPARLPHAPPTPQSSPPGRAWCSRWRSCLTSTSASGASSRTSRCDLAAG